MPGELLIKDVVLFLAATAILVPVAQRLRVNPVLTYILLGVLIGPFGLGALSEVYPAAEMVSISDEKTVLFLAELGVVFLLFMIGLELSLEQLWGLRRYVLGLGGAQVAVTGFVIGAISAWYGASVEAAILLGGSFALSSTAIAMQLMERSHGLASPIGRIAFSILLFQDLMVVPLLFLAAAFGQAGGETLWLLLALAVAKAVAAVALILGVGRIAIRPLFRLAAFAQSREFFLAATLLLVIGTGVITHEAGLSMALGAFLSGLLLSESEFRHQIEVDIAPFKGLLLGVFFVSVGMQLDPAYVMSQGDLIGMSLVGLIAIKAGILILLCLAFRLSVAVSTEVGLLLSQGGEFAFVIVGLAVQFAILDSATAQFMFAVVGASMLATPHVTAAAPEIARRGGRLFGSSAAAPEVEGDAPRTGHVIVAGLGRVGQVLARVLEAGHIPYVAVDGDVGVVSDHRLQGRHVRFGDIGNPQVLARSGIAHARAVVLTIDDPQVANRAMAAIAANWPQVPVLARARDAGHAQWLLHKGASEVVPETVEASLQLAARVLECAGVDEETTAERIAAERAFQQRLMSALRAGAA